MRLFHVVISSLAIGMAGLPALAQGDAPPPGGGGGAGGAGAGGAGGAGGGQRPPRANMQAPLTPEQLKAAWGLEATHVSKGAGLNADETGKVVTAYQSARESHAKAMQEALAKLMDQARDNAGGGGGGNAGAGGEGNAPDRRAQMQEARTKAMAEVNKTEREKFEKALNGFLKPEQTAKVIEPLGTFMPTADGPTAAIVDFKLDDAKQTQAMDAIMGYSAAVGKAAQNTDAQARRDATQAARTKLNDTMKGILSEEQMTKFSRSLAGGGGRPGGAGGAGGEGGNPRRRPPGGGGAGGQGGGGGGGTTGG